MTQAAPLSSYRQRIEHDKAESARLVEDYHSRRDARLEAQKKRAATAPIDFNFPTSPTFPGGIDSAQPSAAVLLRECRGIAAASQRAISNRLSTLELQAGVMNVVNGEETFEPLPANPLSAVLKRPHKNFSQSQFLRLTGDWMGSVGEAYYLKIDNGLRVPSQLQPMNPKNVVPVVTGGEVTSYVITDGAGVPRSHPADVVVRCYFPDPESPHAAEGLLAPVGIEVDSLKFSGEHHREHFKNDATPRSVMKAQEGAVAWTEPEKTVFYEKWVQAYHQRQGKRTGLPAFLPLNWDLIQIASQSGADVVPLLQYWRDTVLMGYGVPKSILGLVESGDRSSAETNQYVFDRHVIVPFAKIISDALTWQLAVDFDPKLVVQFKDFVSADKEFKLKERESDLRTLRKSINMTHDDDGSDHVEWGDDPAAPFSIAPYRPDERLELEEDDTTQVVDDGGRDTAGGKFDEDSAITSSNVLNGAQVASIVELIQGVASGLLEKSSAVELMGVAFGIDPVTAAKIIGNPKKVELPEDDERSFSRSAWLRKARAAVGASPKGRREITPIMRATWLRQTNIEKQFIPSFVRELRKVFKLQSDDAVANLEATEERARIGVEEIFDPKDWVDEHRKTTEVVRRQIFTDVTSDTLEALTDTEFVFSQSMEKQLRQQGGRMIRDIGKTTQEQIARQLRIGAGKGEGVDALAKRIRNVFKDRSRAQARVIARTEVLKASQASQLEGFDQSGVVEKKQWNTSLDNAVRDSHGTAEGQIVETGEAFVLGDGELADAPGIGEGGGQLSAANSVNCRCFTTPVIE